MFVAKRPFFHLHSNRRLLSKFHGPFFSTHFSWYSELNLNCSILFPTSTICKSEPIFHANLNMFFKALWFLCQSDSNLPKRLKAHSSRSSNLLLVVIEISSSSSFVRWRLSNPSTTTPTWERKSFLSAINYIFYTIVKSINFLKNIVYFLLILIIIIIIELAVTPKRYTGIDLYRNISFHWPNRYGLRYEIDFLAYSIIKNFTN